MFFSILLGLLPKLGTSFLDWLNKKTDADLEKFKTAVGGDVTLNVAELRYKVEIARMAADMRKDDREHWFTAWMVPTAFAVLFTHVAAVRLGSFASFRRCADDFRSSLASRPFQGPLIFSQKCQHWTFSNSLDPMGRGTSYPASALGSESPITPPAAVVRPKASKRTEDVHGRRQMPLPGRVVAAPPGAHGFDANSVLNRRICEVAKARGFEFCIRYVSRHDVQPVGDLSEAEANVILGAGLALMPVQHVAPENWSPSQALGTRNGKNAAKHARQIGFPEGVNVWLDLEGAKTSTPHETMIAYCNAWFAEVEGAGYVSGVYVGARAILTGNELFWRLTTRHYWKSGSRVPDIPHRGYQLIQTIIRNDKIDGVAIDRNLTKNDSFGSSVLWLSTSG